MAITTSVMAVDNHNQKIQGAGPSTVIVTNFFQSFSTLPESEGYTFEVPPRSIKHLGGIRSSSLYLFGRTGRPLNEKEKAQGKMEIILGSISVGFAVHPDNFSHLTLENIADIYTKRITNWKEVGGDDAPIVLVGRETTESSLKMLSQHFTELPNSNFDVVFKRDHGVVNYLSSDAGRYAIGFGATSNFGDLNIVVDDCHGLNVGLVVDVKNANHPIVKAVVNYAASDDWKTSL